jgi:hypothetical protein
MATTSPAGGAGRTDAAPAALAAALRTGPFHRALDEAIDVRRLTLEAVQRRLAAHGSHVSLATLSYWRRGLRRPEGDRSLETIGVLERCLGLPPESLSRLLGPRKPRGRYVGGSGDVVGLPAALGIAPAELAALDGVDLGGNTRMGILSVHDRLRVGADRTELTMSTQLVVSSRVDGVDRWVAFLDPRDGPGHRPEIVATQGCRPGRARVEPERDLLAVELEFDRPLAAGDTYVFEYVIGYAGRRPQSDLLQHGVRMTARLMVLQTHFHPDAVPARCYRYFEPGRPHTERPRELAVPIGPDATGQVVIPDAAPGIHGMRWEWD